MTIPQIAREPFFQFALLGTLLFIGVTQWEHYKHNASKTIVVDDARVNMMIVNYNQQTGHLPTKQQLDALIDNYILEEITYREALNMGLDKDDEIIRRRLSQKYQFIQTDLDATPAPAEEDLQQFYATNPVLFQSDATVSFSQIYFSADKSTDSLALQKAKLVLKELQQGTLTRAPEKGDRFPLQYDYADQTKLNIQQNFGDKPILDTLFNGKIKSWLGPVQSGYGWHLLYIMDRTVKTTIPYQDIREEVKLKFLEQTKEIQDKRALDQLRDKYHIQRAYLNAK